jgi:hypothetical protein
MSTGALGSFAADAVEVSGVTMTLTTPPNPPAASGFWGKCWRSQPPEVFAVRAAGM